MSTHHIAVIPGYGIGKEVMPEGLSVLDLACRRFGIDLDYAHVDRAGVGPVATGMHFMAP